MEKCIILSLKVEDLYDILSGKKTILFKKSMPKCELPIDVYLYCTKGKPFLLDLRTLKKDKCLMDYSIKDFDTFVSRVDAEIINTTLNGKIVAKFTLNKVDRFFRYGNVENKYQQLFKDSCLTSDELCFYLNKKNNFKAYAWHIDNLQIFDKPMELSEFYKNNYQVIQDYESCNNYDCIYAVDNSILGDDGYCPIDECPRLRIKSAPLSWCYAFINR